VFAAALGLTKADADWLREQLITALDREPEFAGEIRHGRLYVIDFEVRTSSGMAMIRSGGSCAPARTFRG
jgi:hypothetical protein